MAESKNRAHQDNILLELRQVGRAVEVAAVDENTGIEVRFQAPVSTSLEVLRHLARQKLRYVINRCAPDRLPVPASGLKA